MANEKQLKLIKQSIEDWNQWRKENSSVKIDLTDAFLRNMNFEDAELSAANLAGANLEGARISKANLDWADLTQAKLSYADLQGAHLQFARLEEATCEGINLMNASLEGTQFNGASMRNSFLTDAILQYSSLIGTDLSNSHLSRVNLKRAHMMNARLEGAMLDAADLARANLSGVNLRGAILINANLFYTNLSGADLTQANLFGAKLDRTNLSQAILKGAILRSAVLLKVDLRNANLSDSSVFGISAWGVELDGADQRNLKLNDFDEPTITADNLDVAQFIYLLLNNRKIREIIDTITSKVVLILGRFSPERKQVLEVIKEELRSRNYIPILFDFEKPSTRDMTETVSTLAHMARFVIADITDAKSIPQELQRIVPDLPSVPVQPLILASEHEYGMFEHFKRFPWVLETYLYENKEDLLMNISERVIKPAEAKARLLTGK